MLDPREVAPERVRPLKRVEYDKLVELGAFEDERIELLHGALVEMSPMGTRHAESIRRLNKVLVLAVGDRATVQAQLPFAASDDSEPEPDFAILPLGDYARVHPEQAILVVEVSETSFRKDSRLKADLYASAAIPVYWIVDVVRDVVHVLTDPRDGRYSTRTVRGRGDTLTLQRDDVDLSILVDAILPPPA